MSEKLIGADDTTGLDHGSDIFVLTRFQAVDTGDMTEFKVKASASGHVKCALYEDDAGAPGDLITAMNTGQAVSSGWNTLNFTSRPVNSGTYYWLAIIIDTGGAALYVNSSGTMKYKALTYSGFTFPDPAGGGFSSLAYYSLEAGWGETESIIPKTSSDSGAGLDTKDSFPAVLFSRAETGSGLETAGINAGLASGDVGTGIELSLSSSEEAISSSDGGSGYDSIRVLTNKAGHDLRLHSYQGQVSIPHKEVRL